MIVVIEDSPFPVLNVNLQAVDLRERVTIYKEQISPAVVVEIEETASPADKTRVLTHAGFNTRILKFSLALIVVKSL